MDSSGNEGRGKLQRTRVVDSGEDLYTYYRPDRAFQAKRIFNDPKAKECREWGMYYPEASGNRQSPIDLISNDASFDQCLSKRPIKFNYSSSRETEVLNNGYTLVVFPRAKQVDSGLRIESIGRSVLSGGPLQEDSEYELSEIRFHWGKDCDRGSEHLINHKAFPMEIQLIHWNSGLYSSIEEAVGSPHGIAIVAMFGQIGREHNGLKVVADALEDVLYKMENFRRLCTFVKGDHPHPGDDGFMADNFRPPQPLNSRIVRASFQS